MSEVKESQGGALGGCQAIIKGFTGENQDDLKQKIDAYCEDLIKFINEPIVDCPHCKGRGVVLGKLPG